MNDDIEQSNRAGAVVITVVLVLWIPAVFAAGVAIPAAADPTTADTSTNTNATDTRETAPVRENPQLSLARDIEAILADQPRSNREKALDTADLALANRQEAASENGLDGTGGSHLATQRTNIRAASTLLGIQDDPQLDGDAKTMRLAEAGVKSQIAQQSDSDQPLGPNDVTLPAVETPHHESPSAAVFALYDRDDVTLTANQVAGIRALDEMPEPTRSELTDVVDAFIAYQRATERVARDLNQSGVPGMLERFEGDGGGGISTAESQALQDAMHEAGIDGTRIRAAQLQLLDEAIDLSNAVEESDAPALSQPASHGGPTLCGLLGSGGMDTYSNYCDLIIDLGGQDTYKNNAGGTGNHQAAALIDVGQANDFYYGRNGGTTGFAAGFFFDAGGSDDYIPGKNVASITPNNGKNGGADGGVAFLVDHGPGKDNFTAGHTGTNGGGHLVGHGFLLNSGSGDDSYEARYIGVNGGARLTGTGMIIDTNGTSTGDYYETTSGSADNVNRDIAGGTQGGNGGAANGGAGFLLDMGDQRDTYDTESNGTNGGGKFIGVGFLLDQGGDDTYVANSTNANGDTNRSLQGTNGGAVSFSSGALLDLGGTDDYIANSDSTTNHTIHGVNGGAYGWPQTGIVNPLNVPINVDELTNDPASGILIDVGSSGDDYLVTADKNITGANGGSHMAASNGLLVDGAGTDTYIVTSRKDEALGVNGGVLQNTSGTLSGKTGVSTDASVLSNSASNVDGSGLLLDLQGHNDIYEQNPNCNGGSSVTDDTWMTKGHFTGAQIDSSSITNIVGSTSITPTPTVQNPDDMTKCGGQITLPPTAPNTPIPETWH